MVTPKLAKANLDESTKALVDKAKDLYQKKLAVFVEHHTPPAYVVKAPGRVNLIGEHVDYVGGYVMPLAIDHSTVAYGTGVLRSGAGSANTTITLHTISDYAPEVVENRKLSAPVHPPDESSPRSWANYVIGVIAQYFPDLPGTGYTLDLAIAFASDLPHGAGLSSSGSLEVATASFIECFLKDMAFSSEPDTDPVLMRAIRCQKAENEWAFSPCGIMDQMIISGAKEGHVMLLDCMKMEPTHVQLKEKEQPMMLVADSKITHDIADSEYGLRRKQAHEALSGMQHVPLYHIVEWRDANLADAQTALEKEKINEVLFARAKHIVTENQRTLECKSALKIGVWERVGELMNKSHASLRDDYEVSCEEVDFLVETAKECEGVYGSRMTGGGFGGSTITLVKPENVDELKAKLTAAYKEKYDKDVGLFVTKPANGTEVLAIDMGFKAT